MPPVDFMHWFLRLVYCLNFKEGCRGGRWVFVKQSWYCFFRQTDTVVLRARDGAGGVPRGPPRGFLVPRWKWPCHWQEGWPQCGAADAWRSHLRLQE